MTGRQRSKATAPLTASVFAFLLTVGALAAAAAVSGFAITVLRGGGASVPRWLTLVAVVGLGSAIVVGSFIDGAWTQRWLVVGIASAGLVTAGTVGVRWLSDSGEIGPLEIAVFAAGIAIAVAAPWLAGRAAQAQLVERLASISERLAESPGAGESTGPPVTQPAGWTEVLLVVAGVIALTAALAYVLPHGPLGHDESVYALKARSWAEGTPATGFGIYRPVGMPLVGWIVLQVSDSETAFRTAALLLAVATAFTMWAIGRTMLSSAAALLGTAAFVVSESYLRRATEFLNDLTSAGLLLMVMFFVWLHFERYPHRWWLVAAAPAAAAAYYVRHGTVLGLIVIAVVAGIIWFRGLAESRRQIAVTAGLFVALLVPHFLYSQRLTGSILGVFSSARTSVGGGGGGLADYAEWFPEHLAGLFGAILMVGGIMYTILLVTAARKDSRRGPAARSVGFLTVTAVAMTILLGLFTHGEPRFVFLPLMALLLVGGQAVWVVLNGSPDVLRRVAVAALVIVVGYAIVTGAGEMADRMDRITARRDVIAEASAVARDDAEGSCTIQAAYVPQITWYSLCATYRFIDDDPAADHEYVLLFAESDRQPGAAQLDAILAETSGTPLAVVRDEMGTYGDGYVYEVVP